MKKIMIVFGTRPEAIKMCPLINELKKERNFEIIVCVTGQHREMLEKVLEIFNVIPDFNLEIMTHGQTVVEIMCKILKGVDEIIKKINPDILLIHGDTSTTLAAGMAAFYNKIPVGHIEAGLRSGNLYSPFPEEFNRKLVTHFADLFFAPTEGNKLNLLKEGIKEEKIFVTGNTVIDALINVAKKNYIFENEILNKIDYKNKKIILITAHRRENWGTALENIFNAVREIVENNDDLIAIFPMHKNPIIRESAKKILGNVKNVLLIEPLDYEPFINLISRAYVILTDSGGIQEEAPSLGVPVLVLRTETERPEAVQAGTVKIVGIEKNTIVEETKKMLQNGAEYTKMREAINPYGVGNSSKKILSIIKKYLKEL